MGKKGVPVKLSNTIESNKILSLKFRGIGEVVEGEKGGERRLVSLLPRV